MMQGLRMLFQKSTASSLTSSSKSDGPACQPLRGDGVISETTDLTNANRDFNTDATIPNKLFDELIKRSEGFDKQFTDNLFSKPEICAFQSETCLHY